MKIYIVIHVSNLKPYLNNIQSRNIIAKPRIDLKQKENKEAKVILAKKVRKVRRSVQNVRELFVKWKNLPTEETNWERAKNLDSVMTHIVDFELR